jgi:hypothetical protein
LVVARVPDFFAKTTKITVKRGRKVNSSCPTWHNFISYIPREIISAGNKLADYLLSSVII